MDRTNARSIYTIGHSTRTIGQFIALLRAYGIEKIVDIRTIPGSQKNPQFNKASLRASLKNSRIGYQHIKELGGLRHSKASSVNTGWENLSFRGYADHMSTDEFAKGLDKLTAIAAKKRTAIMCAEALYWRCHRMLVADALTEQKWKVFHIQSMKSAYKHKLTSFLRIKNGKLFYPEIKTKGRNLRSPQRRVTSSIFSKPHIL